MWFVIMIVNIPNIFITGKKCFPINVILIYLSLMIIDGNRIAGEIRVELKNYVETLKVRKPCLAFILVGDNTASKIYVKGKVEACAFVGIVSQRHELC